MIEWFRTRRERTLIKRAEEYVYLHLSTPQVMRYGEYRLAAWRDGMACISIIGWLASAEEELATLKEQEAAE